MSLLLNRQKQKERPKKGADPCLLLHPNIPKPLHGIAPRVIMGQEWWDIQRREAYANAGYCCEACGVHRSDAKYHKWLEAHEYYEYDYPNGRIRFVKLVALCHSCHNYIHSGRMAIMLKEGKMSHAKYEDILLHGDNLTRGLERQVSTCPDDGVAEWKDWRMVFDGKNYGPSTNSYHEWEIGKWRYWKVPK